METNLKSQLFTGGGDQNKRNSSVPPRQGQKYMISSQDYSTGSGKKTEKRQVPPYGNQEALNNSALNPNISRLSETYGIGEGMMDETTYKHKLNETAPLDSNNIHRHVVLGGSIMQGTIKTCNCPCSCQLPLQDTQSQTTHQNMNSIISTQQRRGYLSFINNSMTLMRLGNQLMNTTTGAQTTTVMGDEGGECGVESNIEDMHYILVNVERLKKRMLGKVEGFEDPQIDYQLFQKFTKQVEENASIGKVQSSTIDNPQFTVYNYE